VTREVYSRLNGKNALLNSAKFIFCLPDLSTFLKNKKTSSVLNSVNPRNLFKLSIKSAGVKAPIFLKSSILKASNILKSDFNESSIFADSSSLS
jgi:hypothetical protein